MNPYAVTGDGRRHGPLFSAACLQKLWNKLLIWGACEVGVLLMIGRPCFEWPLMLGRLWFAYDIGMHLFRGHKDQRRINDAREAFDVVEAEFADEPTPPPITSGERFRPGR